MGWFCWNSRRWVTYQAPRTCPYLGGGVVDCIGGRCAYFEERVLTEHASRKERLLRRLFRRQGQEDKETQEEADQWARLADDLEGRVAAYQARVLHQPVDWGYAEALGRLSGLEVRIVCVFRGPDGRPYSYHVLGPDGRVFLVPAVFVQPLPDPPGPARSTPGPGAPSGRKKSTSL